MHGTNAPDAAAPPGRFSQCTAAAAANATAMRSVEVSNASKVSGCGSEGIGRV
jgi:hypothetical protein